ncbi:MAG: hypothetical protein DMG71_18695 [Acidobacteria bacterium]|nr:MAG: hypothetical protein DMG71_18695 [Acidobacteriota bacterium]
MQLRVIGGRESGRSAGRAGVETIPPISWLLSALGDALKATPTSRRAAAVHLKSTEVSFRSASYLDN